MPNGHDATQLLALTGTPRTEYGLKSTRIKAAKKPAKTSCEGVPFLNGGKLRKKSSLASPYLTRILEIGHMPLKR